MSALTTWTILPQVAVRRRTMLPIPKNQYGPSAARTRDLHSDLHLHSPLHLHLHSPLHLHEDGGARRHGAHWLTALLAVAFFAQPSIYLDCRNGGFVHMVGATFGAEHRGEEVRAVQMSCTSCGIVSGLPDSKPPRPARWRSPVIGWSLVALCGLCSCDSLHAERTLRQYSLDPSLNRAWLRKDVAAIEGLQNALPVKGTADEFFGTLAPDTPVEWQEVGVGITEPRPSQ